MGQAEENRNQRLPFVLNASRILSVSVRDTLSQFSAEIVQRDGINHCLLSQGSEMGSVRCILALQF